MNEQDRLIIQLSAHIKTLEELIDRSSIGYHSLDADGHIIQVNQVWLDTLGYAREEVIGKWFGSFVHEDYLEKFKLNFPKLRDKGVIENFTFMLRHKDGRPVELIFNGMAEKDDEGNFIKTHSAFHKANPEKEILRGKIEDKIINKSRMELMGEMMNAVAHQWRQPLNAIGLIIQDTEEILALSGVTNVEVVENTEKAMDILLKLSNTIEQFADFFSLGTDEELLNVSEIIFNTVRLMNSQIQSCMTDFSFICECPRDYFQCTNSFPPVTCTGHQFYVKGSRHELRQVIMNIISNARYAIIKAQKEGVINRGRLDFHLKHTPDELLISIFNNGSRIPEEVLPRVFDPYFTTKQQGEGVGLGLYITRTLVEKRLGGNISIDNTDRGVITVISLPVQTLAEDAAQSSS